MSNRNILLAAAGGAEPPNPNAWDISKAYYDGPYLGDLSKAVFTSITFSVAGEEANPSGVFFKPDGTKMYVVGNTGDDVNEYTLSTPWIISSATYVQNFSVSSQDSIPQDIFFKPDGTKMYVCGQTNSSVYEYSLSSAWNISTASYVRSFSTSSQTTLPFSMAFKDDGTKMFICGYNNEKVFEYSLSTAWNISSASYTQQFSTPQDTQYRGMAFALDGTEMYLAGNANDNIYQYSLSTAWDISSASYTRSFGIGSQEDAATGIYFKNDGSAFYMIGATSDTVYQYTIGGFSVAAKETNPFGVFFKPDGTIMYITGSDSDAIHSYTLSTAWDISTASFTDTFSVSATSLAPNDLFFKSDGTKMYLVDSNSDDVQEFSLSVAWDISTLSYVQNFSIAAREGISSGLFFKSDGTKMYVVGSGADTVLEYALSSAWDISSASYTQEFSVAAQETAPQSLSFKTDGTEMYMLGSSGDDVNQYSLSTAWDISTASYLQSFAVLPGLPRGLYFREDGMKFFTTDSFLDKVFSYSISEE